MNLLSMRIAIKLSRKADCPSRHAHVGGMLRNPFLKVPIFIAHSYHRCSVPTFVIRAGYASIFGVILR